MNDRDTKPANITFTPRCSRCGRPYSDGPCTATPRTETSR